MKRLPILMMGLILVSTELSFAQSNSLARELRGYLTVERRKKAEKAKMAGFGRAIPPMTRMEVLLFQLGEQFAVQCRSYASTTLIGP